jgi:hypothetical protein
MILPFLSIVLDIGQEPPSHKKMTTGNALREHFSVSDSLYRYRARFASQSLSEITLFSFISIALNPPPLVRTRIGFTDPVRKKDKKKISKSEFKSITLNDPFNRVPLYKGGFRGILILLQ